MDSMDDSSVVDDSWVPEACTLPTAEQPLRRTEFDTVFATVLRSQARLDRSSLRWSLEPESAPMVRDLTTRETACCSFFTFEFSELGDRVQVDVRVPTAYVEVLDALAARAAAGLRSQ